MKTETLEHLSDCWIRGFPITLFVLLALFLITWFDPVLILTAFLIISFIVFIPIFIGLFLEDVL